MRQKTTMRFSICQNHPLSLLVRKCHIISNRPTCSTTSTSLLLYFNHQSLIKFPFFSLRFELGRQAANTKLGPKRVHEVRVRGGNKKYRALRLDAGNFSWGSENCTRKTRVLTVVYNASNNELVRTNTLVKGAVIQVDATPFRQWYEAHYAQTLGKKKGAKADSEAANEKKSNHVQRKLAARKADAKVDSLLDDQFTAGRLYAKIASRPGQSGRCDGYILEGKELEFYVRKIKARK
jgi:small subunit ribosomal protein S8e